MSDLRSRSRARVTRGPFSGLLARFLIIGAIVLAIAACGQPDSPAAAPTADLPSQQPTATAAATSTAAPSATAPELIPTDLEARLAEIERRTEELRNLSASATVDRRFVSEQELADYLLAELSDEEALEDLEQTEAVLKLLDLIPQDSSLFDLYTELLGEQVLGVYDPEEEVFLVLQDAGGFGLLEEVTYVHEYVHWLQDQAYDLEALSEKAEVATDRSLALSALIEGDATAVETAYILKYLGIRDLTALLLEAQAAAGSTADTPYVLRRLLEYPYLEGAEFINRLGDFSATETSNAAFRNPPVTTSQTFLTGAGSYMLRLREGGHEPEPVEIPSGSIDPGWAEIEKDTLGEFFIRTWFEAFDIERPAAGEAGRGWEGDTFLVYDAGDGERILVGVVEWQSPRSDVDDFVDPLKARLLQLPRYTPLAVPDGLPFSLFDGPAGVIGFGPSNADHDVAGTAVIVAPDRDTALQLIRGMLSAAG